MTETRLRVMTWNVWHRFGPPDRPTAIEKVIADQRAQVVLLQEVDLTPGVLAAVAERLGMHHTSAGSHGMGNAILSRWPMTRIAERSLPESDGSPGVRRVIAADIDTPWGSWPVFVTHLHHRFDGSATRLRQVDAVVEFVAERRGDPTRDLPPIVGGDFNAVPDSDEIRRLTGRAPVAVANLVLNDVWEQCGDGPGHTWSSANRYQAEANWPNRRIDYLFVAWPRPKPIGNPVAVHLAGVNPVDGVQASDHYAVVADLRTPDVN